MPNSFGSDLEHPLARALMEGALSGVVQLDAAGCVLRMNDRARRYLDCRDTEAEGHHILNLFPALDRNILEDVLNNGDSIANYFAQNGGQRFAVNIEPVAGDGSGGGAVLIFRRLSQSAGASEGQSTPGLTARHRFSDFKIASENFQRVLKNAKFASQSDAPVLLTGEDGTELPELAECIHNESPRHSCGFAEVECDALSADQISRLLFDQPDPAGEGTISSIRGGTLFLNHVDRLTKDLQYRVCLLIKGQYTARNDIHHYREDVRVVAATDKRLRDLVRSGEFREDLFYALSVVTIPVPPLRERSNDLIDIANVFIRRYSEQFSKPVKFTRGAYDSLLQYAWPGNMRELDYFCKKVILSTPDHSVNEAFIRTALSESVGSGPRAEGAPAEAAVPDARAQEIIDALRRNNGSKTKTAAELGVSKATLWRHMQKYGIAERYG